LYEVPKDPVTSGNAEAGVFVYAQPYAAVGESVSEDRYEHRRTGTGRVGCSPLDHLRSR
jgi:hypothetical protein